MSSGPAWGRRGATKKAEDARAARGKAEPKETITLTVAPFGGDWGVKLANGYYHPRPNRTEARAAAEEWAEELRGKGHEVTILETTKKPGGR